MSLLNSGSDSSFEADSTEGSRLSPTLLGAAVVPQFVAVLALAGIMPLGGFASVLISVLGVLSIAVYRQHVTRVAARPGYERSDLLHRLMTLFIITALVLLSWAVIPFALDAATGACACA